MIGTLWALHQIKEYRAALAPSPAASAEGVVGGEELIEAAASCLMEVLASEPGIAIAHYGLAVAHGAQGRSTKARESAKDALDAGFRGMGQLLDDPLLLALRRDREFLKLVDEVLEKP